MEQAALTASAVGIVTPPKVAPNPRVVPLGLMAIMVVQVGDLDMVVQMQRTLLVEEVISCFVFLCLA